MKILHVTSHAGQGGDWSIIKNFMNIFAEHDHEVFISGSNVSDSQYQSIEMPLNKGLKGLALSLTKLAQIQSDLDVIHVHSPIALLFAAILRIARCHNAKIVFTYHWLINSQGLKKAAKKLLFKLADIVHCYSTDVNIYLSETYDLDERKNKLVYVGVDDKQFSLFSTEQKASLRHKYGVKDNDFVLLFAGRLAPEKNIPVILDYLQQIEHQNIMLLVAGDGDLKEDLHQLTVTLKIDKKVTFLGKVAQIEEIYAIADLLLLPSSSMETFGMVVIEAGLCGLPTLRSDLPGATDQIDHGKDGFIFPKQSKEKMFEIIDEAYGQQWDLEAMGLKARQKAKEKFTLEKMYSEFLELYT